MRKFFISIFFLSILFAGNSQQPILQWAKAFEAHNIYNYRDYSNGRTVGVDQQGNVYSAGLFMHTVDFDPGPALYTQSGAGPFDYGIYISKLDADGNFIWAKQIPVLVEFGDIELKIDNTGNIILTSELRYPADMDPGPGVQIMTPIGPKDVFIIKLDSDGNLIWVKQFGGPGDTVPKSNVLDIDDNNNVIICGLFNNTVDFDPSPNTYNLTSTAHLQSFIAKLNSNGDLIWAKQFGNSPVVYSGSNILDIKCDAQGNIFTVGSFAGTCDFDPGMGVYNLTASGSNDGLIAKLNAQGDFVWAKKIANNTNNNGQILSRGIDIDNTNNVVTTGTFIGTFDFDPGAVDHNISSLSSYDSYVLKLNEVGELIWVKIIGSSDHDSGNDLAIDNDNNIYLIGSYGPSVDFDPGPGDFTINSPYYGAEALVKLNSNGNFVYAAPFQSISYGTSLFRRMDIDAAQNIYVTGFVSGTVDFDPGPNVFPLSGYSEQAPFVLKLSRCLNVTTATLNINECNSYTLNNETFDSSGTYIQTIQNASGCDSVITLNLIINKKFSTQTKDICEGDTFFAGGANQTTSGTYIDTLQTILGCDSVITTHLTVSPKPSPNLGPNKDLCNNTQLTVTPGSFTSYLWQNMSTQNNFTITASGTYWVTVTNSNNCSATDSLVINTVLPPSNFLKEKDSICSYDKLTLKSLNNFNSYQWSTGITQNNIIITSPGQYWLRVTDDKGCIGMDTTTIYSKQCTKGVFIPTAFTPNGDGKNDMFKAIVFGNVQSFKLEVFDRSGAPVFQTTNPDKYWDGFYKGKSYSTTTFVWQCFYQLENEKPEFQKGTMTLIR